MSSTGTRHPGGWRALHIYLPHSLQTGFLRDAIRPAVRDAGVRDRFFFLRYWQGGPHIRLRIHGAGEDVVESVRSTVAAAIPPLTPELTAEYEYEVSMQGDLADLEDEQTAAIRTPGTVEPAAYSPEYDKYGGDEGIRIAEELFCATSVAVLDLAAARGGTEPKAPVGEAIRIMAMSLKGSGLDIGQSREFLGRYETWWRRYVPPGYDEQWPGLYDKTREKVTNLCTSVWHDGKTDVFHDTYAKARAAAGAVQDASNGAELTELTLGRTPYARCLSNYVHTTNNRLGIIPAGEAFVAHVMRRSLAELNPP